MKEIFGKITKYIYIYIYIVFYITLWLDKEILDTYHLLQTDSYIKWLF